MPCAGRIPMLHFKTCPPSARLVMHDPASRGRVPPRRTSRMGYQKRYCCHPRMYTPSMPLVMAWAITAGQSLPVRT